MSNYWIKWSQASGDLHSQASPDIFKRNFFFFLNGVFHSGPFGAKFIQVSLPQTSAKRVRWQRYFRFHACYLTAPHPHAGGQPGRSYGSCWRHRVPGFGSFKNCPGQKVAHEPRRLVSWFCPSDPVPGPPLIHFWEMSCSLWPDTLGKKWANLVVLMPSWGRAWGQRQGPRRGELLKSQTPPVNERN